MSDPFADMLAALTSDVSPDEGSVRVDPTRETRSGAPEVVYAAVKSPEQTLTAMLALVETTGRGIASRVPPDQMRFLREQAPAYLSLDIHEDAGIAILRHPDAVAPHHSGTIGVLSAGTSDIPTAREAAIIAREMGCEVIEAHDAGVAGLHRLVSPLRHFVACSVSAIVVAAGMDGALPPVVAGLVSIPVIGLPTSTGYGAGGSGQAALQTMLQSCAPGLLVVNIDNGIGAGISAALIARQSCPKS